MKNKTKVAITLGAVSAGVAAWAASKAIVKRTPRETKALLQNKETPFIMRSQLNELQREEHFATTVYVTQDEQLVATTIPATEPLPLGEIKYRTAEQLTADYPQFILLEELHERLNDRILFIMIGDEPSSFEGSLIPSKLWEFIQKTNRCESVMIASEYEEQLDRFNLYAQNEVVIVATEDEVKKAYAAYSSALGHLYQPNADVAIIRLKDNVLRSHQRRFISFLNQLNVQVMNEVEHSDTSTENPVIGIISFDR
ncbi:hypothetical protein IRY55_00615 [Savagea sp. SN6]|uniref:Uncharacterized protein n=1 Tax=Savagea serpentis TaxID=2785297 RepID=A0A8J7G8M9_9BACL|nr:hypothetical protein [Savagea serpentis]MBF4499845.1 hypothetical protein [Savagea serpentis]